MALVLIYNTPFLPSKESTILIDDLYQSILGYNFHCSSSIRFCVLVKQKEVMSST